MTEEQKIKHDVEIYGNGFGLMNQDGSVTRLDPTMVFTFKSPDNKNTDLGRFKQLYDGLDIKYLLLSKDYQYEMIIGEEMMFYPTIDAYLEVIDHNKGRINGFGSFHTIIIFDKDGKFISQGFWQ